jgi:hypothetical protein
MKPFPERVALRVNRKCRLTIGHSLQEVTNRFQSSGQLVGMSRDCNDAVGGENVEGASLVRLLRHAGRVADEDDLEVAITTGDVGLQDVFGKTTHPHPPAL